MAYTSHGHQIPGTPVEDNGALRERARCGGPGFCDVCSNEIAAYIGKIEPLDDKTLSRVIMAMIRAGVDAIQMTVAITEMQKAGVSIKLKKDEEPVLPDAEKDRNDLVARIDLLESTLREVINRFTEYGHPGFSAVRTHWIEAGYIGKWNAVLSGKAQAVKREYHGEETLTVVFNALSDSGLNHAQVLDAIREMQNAGILFRERMRS